MELQQLRYFKAAAEIGKISEAAESLFVSAPALSTSISKLEKELGISLFDRTNNRIILNPQGQIFLNSVNHIFDTLEEAKLEMQQSLLQQGPHLSIISLNTAVWVNLITTFLSEYPQYTLSSATVSLAQLAQHGFHAPNSFLLAYETDIPPIFRKRTGEYPFVPDLPDGSPSQGSSPCRRSGIGYPYAKGRKGFFAYSGISSLCTAGKVVCAA